MMVMQQQQLWQWSIDRDDEDTTPKLVPVLVLNQEHISQHCK